MSLSVKKEKRKTHKSISKDVISGVSSQGTPKKITKAVETGGPSTTNVASTTPQATSSSTTAVSTATKPSALVLPDLVRLSQVSEDESFDYDALADEDNLELCILRVPDGIKAKHLAGFSFVLPTESSSSSSSNASHLGTYSRKSTSYDLWTVSKHLTSGHDRVLNEDSGISGSPIGGDEMLGLTCLVPRRRKNGHLFCAPKPIAHHLILAVQPAKPATTSISVPNAPRPIIGPFAGPPRYHHPKHLLKHRFLPTGTLQDVPSKLNATPADANERQAQITPMQVDDSETVPEPSSISPKATATAAPEAAATLSKAMKKMKSVGGGKDVDATSETATESPKKRKKKQESKKPKKSKTES